MTFKKSPGRKHVLVQSSVLAGAQAVLETYCFADDAVFHVFDGVDRLRGFFSDFQGSFLLASGLHDAGKWLSVLMF